MADVDHDPHFPSIQPLGDPPAKKSFAPGQSGFAPPSSPTERATKSFVPPDLQSTDVPCRNCGFNLRGLAPDGNCPECGAPIWRSISEDRLIHCGKSYVLKLYRGLVCILIAALASLGVSLLVLFFVGVMIAVGFSSGAAAAWMQAINNNQALINVVTQMLMLPISFLLLYGWWLFSEPDPGAGSDTGQKPRRIVRTSTIAMAGATAIALICQTAAMTISWMDIVAGGVSFINQIALIVQFFASMLYVRWLAPRIPSPAIENRARLYMWLLPVIFVAGMCVLVGPFVAMIMYYLLLNDVRVQIKKIIEAQESGFDGRPSPPSTQ